MANQDFIKFINDFYKQKPQTPQLFSWSPQQQQAARQSVGAQYKPFYQEQADLSNMQYNSALNNTRNSFSRRNLWGAAVPQGVVQPAGVDAINVNSAIMPGSVNYGGAGPVSSLRRQGEFQVAQSRYGAQANIARDYQTALQQGVLQRQKEAQDVYQKTVQDPYQQQLTDWQNRLLLLQANYYR